MKKIIINPFNGCNVGCSYCNCPNKFITAVAQNKILSLVNLHRAMRQVVTADTEYEVEISGGEPCVIEKEQILAYIDIIATFLPDAPITVVTNGHREVEYYQYLFDNAHADLGLRITYHSQFFDEPAMTEKVRRLVTANPARSILLKVPLEQVGLFPALEAILLPFSINADPEAPNIHAAVRYEEFIEIYAAGNYEQFSVVPA